MKKPIWKKIICIMLSLVIILPVVFITTVYLLWTSPNPLFKKAYFYINEHKVINSLYECKDELIFLAEYMQNHPKHRVEWSYLEPDELRVGADREAEETGSDKKLQDTLDVLKKEGFQWISGEIGIVSFEYCSARSEWQGIIYCKSDPKEYYKSGRIMGVVIKETDVENFYYCQHSNKLAW